MILDDCNADAERYRATQLLCNYFSMAGNTSEAFHLLEGVADIRRPMCWNYRRLAELYLLQSDTEGAYQALLVAEKHAKEFDELTSDTISSSPAIPYTSPFTNTLKYVPEQHTKHWVGTERKMLLYRLKEMEGCLGEHEGVKELKERLEKATAGSIDNLEFALH